MLHIIGMILKIIGIILAVILGILVLLVCIVLFVPLKYSVDGQCNGKIDSIKAVIKCSWLFHLISGQVTYEEGELKWQARIVIKKLSSSEEVETPPTEPDKAVHVKQHAEETKEIERKEIEEKEPTKSREQSAEQEITTEENILVKSKIEKRRKNNLLVRIKEKIVAFLTKLKEILKNIKYTFRRICDKIKILLEKKELAVEFIEDEGHRLAFSRVKKEGLRFFKFLKPKKFIANARFGFEDPCTTGKVLAALGVVYPFIGKGLCVEPDFENKVLEGDVHIKGKIRVIFAVIIAWNLFWDKNVRRLYADIRRIRSS